MSMLDSILSAGNGGLVKQLAGQFGITADQAASATSALLPTIAAGVQEKLATGDTTAFSDFDQRREPKQVCDRSREPGDTRGARAGQVSIESDLWQGDLSSVGRPNLGTKTNSAALNLHPKGDLRDFYWSRLRRNTSQGVAAS